MFLFFPIMLTCSHQSFLNILHFRHGSFSTDSNFFLLDSSSSSSLSVVSAGSGSKCLGPPDTSPHGELLHDSHAEVIAKRAFQRCVTKNRTRICIVVQDRLPETNLISLLSFRAGISWTRCGWEPTPRRWTSIPDRPFSPSSPTSGSTCSALTPRVGTPQLQPRQPKPKERY